MGRSLLVPDQSKGDRGGPHAVPSQSKATEKRLAGVKGTSSEELESRAYDWSPRQAVGGALLPNGPDWEGGRAGKEVAN